MKKILLVEDEPLARMVNTRFLQTLGYIPDVAITGEEAVAMSRTGYDVIFMDIGLPGIDGLEATRQIRAYETAHGWHSTIIALSAYAIATHRDKCIEAGMDDMANKPIAIDKLQALIESVPNAIRQ
jgi:CheY-like chemotaxis protein